MDKKKQVIELLEKYGNETDMFKAFITQDEFVDLAEEIVKLFAIPDVMGELTCDSCGCHPNVIYTTSKGRFCERCKPAS